VRVDGREQLVRRPALEDLDVLLEVLTDAERATGSGEHHAAHCTVLGCAGDRPEESLLAGHVEAVHRGRTVQRDRRDAVGHGVQDGGAWGLLGHRFLLGRAGAFPGKSAPPRNGWSCSTVR